MIYVDAPTATKGNMKSRDEVNSAIFSLKAWTTVSAILLGLVLFNVGRSFEYRYGKQGVHIDQHMGKWA